MLLKDWTTLRLDVALKHLLGRGWHLKNLRFAIGKHRYLV